MQILLFHKEHIEKILGGNKTMTSRLWKRKPFKPGETVRAQINRRKDSTFAYLKITKVIKWSGCPDCIPEDKIDEVVRKEGFQKYSEFWGAWYGGNNANNFLDNDYKPYFLSSNLWQKVIINLPN